MMKVIAMNAVVQLASHFCSFVSGFFMIVSPFGIGG